MVTIETAINSNHGGIAFCITACRYGAMLGFLVFFLWSWMQTACHCPDPEMINIPLKFPDMDRDMDQHQNPTDSCQ